jgi:hypothetical protein
MLLKDAAPCQRRRIVVGTGAKVRLPQERVTVYTI